MSLWRKKLLNFFLKNLYCAILEDEILPWKSITPEERGILIDEATLIKSSRLFDRLTESMKQSAHKRMFEKSQSWDDMYFGKAVLYVVEILKSRVEALSKAKK